MAKGNVSYPNNNNQPSFREIITRLGVLHAFFYEIFMHELKKTSPELDFELGLIVYCFGEKPLLIEQPASDIKKLFEFGYLENYDVAPKLSARGINLQNKLNTALEILEVPENALYILNELIKTIAVKKLLQEPFLINRFFTLNSI